MKPVTRPSATQALNRRTRSVLTRRQAKADGFAVSDKRIDPAWSSFGRTVARDEVMAALEKMFGRRCAYCENIVPRDIEHFYPKSGYPKKMFRWTNFLLSCKNCNHSKLNSFPVSGGRPVLIDPTQDDPADFFSWDLATGYPVLSADPQRAKRADATVRAFHLDNGQLCEERRIRSARFTFFLVECKDPSASAEAKRLLLDELSASRPWRSVLRQIVRDPKIARVVAKVKVAVPAAAPMLDELSQ